MEEPENEVVTQSGRTVRYKHRPEFDNELQLGFAAFPAGPRREIVFSFNGPGRESVFSSNGAGKKSTIFPDGLQL